MIPVAHWGRDGQRLKHRAIRRPDWRGSGRVLILLAGFAVPARDFDGFAATLRKNHHVLGITRRGFAPSSIPTKANQG